MKYLKRIKYTFPALLIFILNISAQAQAETGTPDMADTMRGNGKIYVVVTALSLIFCGIVIYLISLDRKLRKLEKLLQNSKK
jgi:CcmD family protein